MIDLHCHILPGVDDGSADEEESCAMARLAVESGVTDIAATPHCNAPDPFYNYADSALHARFARLRQRLEREQGGCSRSAGRGICSSSSPSARASGSSTRCSPPCARGG